MYRRITRRPVRSKTKRAEPIRLESLRCSPYMFYHVGSDPPEGGGGPAHQRSGAGADNEGSPHRTFQELATAAITEADVEFTGGEIVKAIEGVAERFDAHARHTHKDIFEREISTNITSLNRIFSKAVPLTSSSAGEGDMPMIPKAKFRAVCKDVLDVESDALLEIFVQHLDRQNTGFISFVTLMGHFEAALNGPLKEKVADACFSIFDPLHQLVITHKMITAFRACKPARLIVSTSGATSAMVKAVLDVWSHKFSHSDTMGIEEFRPMLLESEVLIFGFFEEILRQILVQFFNVDRAELVKLHDAATAGAKP